LKTYSYDLVLSENQLPKLVARKCFGEPVDLSDDRKVAGFIAGRLMPERMAEEYVYLLSLDTFLRVIAVFELSHGNAMYAIATPREAFMRLLLTNGSRFIVVHNHPGGSMNVSREDMNVYRKFRECGDLMGIPMVRFVIVGDGIGMVGEDGFLSEACDF